ncbi:DUF4129 domain-containing protein [Brevibacillus ginsengisoli]|uniref:DUF4129 domain-containing protein n=1 Tax=Brevibacillus ginsengisoli TaxID=363854 RepID=UPI003CE81A9B
MTTKTMLLLRSILLVSLEVYLVVGGLVLCLFVDSTTSNLLELTFLGIGLISLGCWLYQGGNGSIIYHVLLYPLVAIVLYMTYQAFGLILSLVISGLFYWRIQFAMSNQFTEQDYLKRFLLAGLLYATCLIYFVIIHIDCVPIFWQLSTLLGWYMLIRWGEYMTREHKEALSISRAAFSQYVPQVVITQLLMVLGYLVSAGAVLSLFYFIWQVIKKPLGQILSLVMDPIIALIMIGVNKLSAIIGKSKNTQQIISQMNSNGDIQGKDIVEQSPTLIEQLEPYLIAGSILIFAIVLGIIMWRRKQLAATGGQAISVPKNQTTQSLEHLSASPSLKDQLRSFYQRFQSTEQDVVRQQYEQFLRYMASLGLIIEASETPAEFLRRVKTYWTDQEKKAIAVQITAYYERHRYDQDALTPEEIQQLKHSLEQLRKLG